MIETPAAPGEGAGQCVWRAQCGPQPADLGLDVRRKDGRTCAAPGKAGASATAQPGRGASGQKSADWEPWSPSDGSPSAETPPPAPQSDVVVPPRKSIWSTIFHLPGDATVVGMQYVAYFLDADNLSRELQILSRKSDKITLSILAGFWWLVIIKVLVGTAMTISRFMKVAATPRERVSGLAQ